MTQSSTFPLFEKVRVNGPNAHEVFKFLRGKVDNLKDGDKIHWNFGKFLVDASGKKVRYFNPRGDPAEVEAAVREAMK